ncbi:BatA and WFA domain-containing protein [bacterium]|nr:BatA and WFA domain-containing protein [bacterium]RQV92217.1 MAG: hypothetical protein EH221_11935 [bacterium]
MFSFLNSTILFAAAGVAIPFLIHFFARHKLQKVLFSDTMFLKQLQTVKMRRIRIRQLLLLILRCLALLFFVLAFARPTVKATRTSGRGQARSSIALIMDNSFSMGREGLFNQAQERALFLLDLLQSEDEAALVWTVPATLHEVSFRRDRSGLHQSVLKEQVGWNRGILSQSIDQAISILAESNNINREIYVVSDMQKTGFPSPADSQHVLEWDGPFFVLPVSQKMDNIALIGGGVTNQILQMGTPLEIYADIRNDGDRSVEDLLVRVFLKDDAHAQKVVRLEAGETVHESFSVIPEEDGWIWGSIQVESDGFPQDNVWYFSCWIPELTRVLLVGNSLQDVRPLKMALNYQQAQQSLYQIVEMLYQDPWMDRLNETEVVFCSNVPLMKSEEANRLKQFVEAGGGLFFLMGDLVDLRTFTNLFFNPAMGLSLGNREGDFAGSGGALSFGDIDYGHPVFKGMFEKGKENIQSPRFFQMIDIIGTLPKTVISFRNGKPFLVEMKLGKGSVFLATSGIGEDWSDWVYSSIFSPLIYRSAAYLASQSYRYENLKTVGESIFITTGIENMDVPYSVVTPDGDEIITIPEIERGEVRLTVNSADKPGIYTFYRGESRIGIQVVNRDPMESDFEMIPEKDLRRVLPEAEIHQISDIHKLETEIEQVRWGRELWREMLLFGMVLLIVEMVVARESRKK